MKLALVVIEDRHVDVEVVPFRDQALAVEYARAFLMDPKGANRHGEAAEEPVTPHMSLSGWIMYGSAGDDGPHVRVQLVTVREAL